MAGRTDRQDRRDVMNCPKCNGSAGFTYNLIMKTNRSGDWGLDDDEETDVESIRDVKTVTCMDCGKRIDWNIAHGIQEELE
jgi:transcription elongation factor Elf1